MAHNNLGNAFKGLGELDDAVAEYRQAAELDPTASAPHGNLGTLLKDRGDLKGAVAEFRLAIELEPKGGFAHFGLGLALKQGGDLDGAVSEFHQSLVLQPDGTGARFELVKALAPRGRLEEVRAAWGAAFEHAPRDHDVWYGYAELCLFLGRDEEYRRNRRALLDRFGDTTDLAVAERTARACLLLPPDGADLTRAAALADRAAAPGPAHEYYRFFLAAKGLADYRRGRFDAAIDGLQHAGEQGVWMPVARPVLAMALHRAGRAEEAREALAAAVQSYDWDEAKADNQDAWIGHVLRREAEELIVPNLAAFLKGEYQPKDNKERLELAGYCRFRKRYVSAARLYAEAFAADPKLLADPNSGNRYNAACCAAQAGCGDGRDEKERARWREQARDWLRADVALWAKRLESGKSAERQMVTATLKHWQEEADLSGLRVAADVARLPADEQEACEKLWANVRALLDKMDAKK
jgi:serine/threonine-protein kinase